MEELSVLTRKKHELVDITEKVKGIIEDSGIKDGLALIFVPHSTASVVLTENEKGLKEDWLKVLEKLVSDFDFVHNKIDDNADAHILSGLLGQGKTLIIENGKLILGSWQQIFLAEFDGPRTRKILVQINKIK